MSKLPLEGVRVIDLTVVFSGPTSTLLLADLGAEVIKVEDINRFATDTRGMSYRPTPKAMAGAAGTLYPNRDAGEEPWNRCALFNFTGRNKLSMTVDLTRPEGKEIFKELVKISNIVIENNSAGTMEKLGLGYPTLREVRPDIILISMPAFGNSGPYAHYKGFAAIVEAIIGHTWLRGYPNSAPTQTGPQVYHCDATSGVTAAFAALVALYHQRRTGDGQFIDLSQAETVLPHLGEFFLNYEMNGREPTPVGNRNSYGAVQGCYQCKGNDQWITLTIGSDKEWDRFCRALGNPEWTQKPAFSDLLARYRNHDQLDQQISWWARDHEPHEIMHLLQQEGIACGPVLSESDVLAGPHVKERNFFLQVSQADTGTYPYPGFAWKMSATAPVLKRPPPRLGEDNDYVYRQLLRKTEEDIARLKQEGHIGTEYHLKGNGHER